TRAPNKYRGAWRLGLQRQGQGLGCRFPWNAAPARAERGVRATDWLQLLFEFAQMTRADPVRLRPQPGTQLPRSTPRTHRYRQRKLDLALRHGLNPSVPVPANSTKTLMSRYQSLPQMHRLVHRKIGPASIHHWEAAIS